MKDFWIVFSFCSLLIISSCNDSYKNGENNVISLSEIKAMKDGILLFENKICDKDTVKIDTLLKAVYNFENIGRDTVIINYVNPECTCTSYKVSSKWINPGEKGFIELTLDTKDKKGLQKVYAVVNANTNDRFYRLLLRVYIL